VFCTAVVFQTTQSIPISPHLPQDVYVQVVVLYKGSFPVTIFEFITQNLVQIKSTYDSFFVAPEDSHKLHVKIFSHISGRDHFYLSRGRARLSILSRVLSQHNVVPILAPCDPGYHFLSRHPICSPYKGSCLSRPGILKCDCLP
jgi:hypothetical protein